MSSKTISVADAEYAEYMQSICNILLRLSNEGRGINRPTRRQRIINYEI